MTLSDALLDSIETTTEQNQTQNPTEIVNSLLPINSNQVPKLPPINLNKNLSNNVHNERQNEIKIVSNSYNNAFFWIFGFLFVFLALLFRRFFFGSQ